MRQRTFFQPSLEYAVIYSKKNNSSQTRLFDIKTRVFAETNSLSGDKLAGCSKRKDIYRCRSTIATRQWAGCS
jgi:hypothetical protein